MRVSCLANLITIYLIILIAFGEEYEGVSKSFRTESIKIYTLTTIKSRDSSVSIALDYGLEDRSSRVLFLVGAGNFSLRHRVQNGSGAHPAFYPMGTRGSFPGIKRPGREADQSHPSSAKVKE
jgi:hypothetical protein